MSIIHRQCQAGKNCVIALKGQAAIMSPLQMETTRSFYCIPCAQQRTKARNKALNPNDRSTP